MTAPAGMGQVYRLGSLQRAASPAAKAGRRSRGAKVSEAAGQVWLLLRDEGGWWTASEVGRVAGLPWPAGMQTGAAAGRWLAALAARGHVQRNPRAARLDSYGVTARCVPLPGFSMEPGELSTGTDQLI